MTNEQLKYLTANELARMTAAVNNVVSVKPQTTPTPQSSFTLTFSGSATASAKTIAIKVEGTILTFSTTAAQSATNAAAAAAPAWQTSLNTAFGANAYTLVANSGTITWTRNDGGLILVDYYYSLDATQKIAVASGYWFNRQILLNAKVAGTGEAKRVGDGYEAYFDLPNSNRSVKLFVQSFLVNEAAAAKSCRWKVMWYYPNIGWRTDSTAGLMTISSTGAAGTEITFGSSGFEAVGATRVAIALQDNGAAGNLADCGFFASAIFVN